jgi:hypothetical protein
MKADLPVENLVLVRTVMVPLRKDLPREALIPKTEKVVGMVALDVIEAKASNLERVVKAASDEIEAKVSNPEKVVGMAASVAIEEKASNPVKIGNFQRKKL